MGTFRLPLATLLGLVAMLALGQRSVNRIEQRIDELRASGALFRSVELFQAETRSASNDALWSGACTEATVLRFDREATRSLIGSRSELISMQLTDAHGRMTLDLQRVEILSDDFHVTRSSGGGIEEAPEGVHYQGVLRGERNTVVAISVFDGYMMGLIADDDGQRVLGPIENGPEDLHVLYRERDLLGTFNSPCGTAELPTRPRPAVHDSEEGDRTIRCVKMYWEAAYEIYVNKGSVANVTSYLTGLFNQSAVLYQMDGIQIQLNQIFVWNTTSPYNGASAVARLTQFQTVRTSFNGDLALLLDYSPYGGLAPLNTLCGTTSERMAYSGIASSYQNVPTYSWSVLVVTHETGHLLGSNHTHACVWNGNNTAIDGCWPVEGGCATPAIPTGGGTIMSYCHAQSVGTNFNNGFGPQPGTLIRNTVNTASCLLSCGGTCDTPISLGYSIISSTSVSLTWANMGAAGYDLQWKPVSSPNWTVISNIATNSRTITGLTAGTAYHFQVRSRCGGPTSPFSSLSEFSIPAGACDDAMEPNGSLANAAVLTLPTTVNAQINSTGDLDTYSFTLTGVSQVNISLTNLPAGYDVFLLNADGDQLSASQNPGTTNESISYAAEVGVYYIGVLGFGGAYHPYFCYALNVTATPLCNTPQGLGVTGITTSTATLNWPAVPGAVAYAVRRKPVSSSTWIQANGYTLTSMDLTNLLSSTTYEFQVRSECPGFVHGLWTPSFLFTTACPDAMEPNNTNGTAATLAVPGGISALIANENDLDVYSITTLGTSQVSAYLTNLAADYDLYLYNSDGTEVDYSANGGTDNELVIYTGPPGTYYIHVFGFNGVYDPIQCYSLNVNSVLSCNTPAPSGLNATGISNNGATLGWSAVSGAAGYQVEWKPTSGATWSSASGITTTSYNVAGLASGTQYEFRVRTVCSGGAVSVVSSSYLFTTTSTPCAGSPSFRISPTFFLEGPYRTSTQLMSDTLRVLGLIPLNEPYTAMGLAPMGTLTTTASVLAVSGNNAIVDWVLVELRDPNDPALVFERQAGLLQRDGDVVAVNGFNALGFCSPPGSYKVAVRHRNHLGCMTNSAVNFVGGSTSFVNFTSAGTGTYGTEARKTIGSVMALWAGNTNGDGSVRYTGESNDRDPILVRIGGVTPTNTVVGYYPEDVNLDGVSKYTGANNDRDPILVNIGGVPPTNVRTQQLP